MDRRLEPEVMDDAADSAAYDAMDFAAGDEAFVEAALAACATGRALDVGCGPGKIAVLLRARGGPGLRVVAGDMAATMLAIARGRVRVATPPGVALVRFDAKRLPFGDATFDLVVSNSVLHHIPDPVPYLAEIARVAGTRGVVRVRDLFRPPDDASAWRLVARAAPHADTAQQRLFFDSLCAALTVEEAVAAARMAGLADADVRCVSERHLEIARDGRDSPLDGRGSPLDGRGSPLDGRGSPVRVDMDEDTRGEDGPALTGKQRRHLRSLGHHLTATLQVGQRGVTEALIAACAEALVAHELIKVRLSEEDRDERRAQARALAEASGGALVQELGRTVLLYRAREEDPAIRLPK